MRCARVLAALAVSVGLSVGQALSAPSGDPVSPVPRADPDDQQIVLRTVRMPDAFGTHLLALDAGPQLIDRERPVAQFWDADVWIVGLRDWSDTSWLSGSPLHALFAPELHNVPQEARFKSFEWNAGAGRQLDLHFVNLGQATAMGEACLAQTLYRLSQLVVAKRRAQDSTRLTGRAHPKTQALIVAEDHQLCP